MKVVHEINDMADVSVKGQHLADTPERWIAQVSISAVDPKTGEEDTIFIQGDGDDILCSLELALGYLRDRRMKLKDEGLLVE